MKLFLVTCKGMRHSIGSALTHGVAYVVANDAAEAYKILRRHLDAADLGFDHDRELDTVQLLADEGDYPPCGTRVFVKRRTQPKDTKP